MVASRQTRASGETGATEEAREAAESMTDPITVDLPEETRPRWRTPGFQRMRFTFSDDQRPVIDRARAEAERVIVQRFSDAYWILNEIYDIVREPVIDPVTGEPARDHNGLVVWKRNPSGLYIEDFTLLNRKQKEHFLGLITVRLFTWEGIAADMWADAMFAKAQFEERFAIAYDAPMRDTVEGRNAKAAKDAAEERYFAIFLTVLSRRADSVVKSMDRLSQRLKDILVAG